MSLSFLTEACVSSTTRTECCFHSMLSCINLSSTGDGTTLLGLQILALPRFSASSCPLGAPGGRNGEGGVGQIMQRHIHIVGLQGCARYSGMQATRQAADVVKVVGIGRNEYIATLNKCKAKKLLWRVNRAIARELLPAEPLKLVKDDWWIAHVVNLSAPPC